MGRPLVNRKQFFEDLNQMTFTEIADKYILPREQSWKQIVKGMLRYVRTIIRTTRMHPRPLWQLLKYNTVSEIFHGNILLPTPYCVIQINRKATIHKQGITFLGQKRNFVSQSLKRVYR